jgi:prepilin-type N-terminal cleavage/methylation domain-containing protein
MITRLAHPTRALRAGFSLIEMMVTVSMLGIMAGMVAPKVSKDISHSRVNSAARVVAVDLEQALSLAGRQRRPVRLVIDGSAKQIQLVDRVSGQLISRRAFGATTEYKLYSISARPLRWIFCRKVSRPPPRSSLSRQVATRGPSP